MPAGIAMLKRALTSAARSVGLEVFRARTFRERWSQRQGCAAIRPIGTTVNRELSSPWRDVSMSILKYLLLIAALAFVADALFAKGHYGQAMLTDLRQHAKNTTSGMDRWSRRSF
jgi:hypothetical protein